MAAPLTADQQADLSQFKDLVVYLEGILYRQSSLAAPALTAANITEINDTITDALDSIQAIIVEWATPAP
jgi:hypothetical protein